MPTVKPKPDHVFNMLKGHVTHIPPISSNKIGFIRVKLTGAWKGRSVEVELENGKTRFVLLQSILR